MSNIDGSNQKAVIQAINRQLEQRGYLIIKPIRLSYEIVDQGQLNYQAQLSYQGLTKVNFDKQHYLVKWQLQSVEVRQATSLDAEIITIKRLQQTVSQWPDTLLDYELLAEDKITVNDQLYRFDGVVMPFFELGSLNSYLKSHTLSAQSKLQLAINIAKSIQQLHHIGWVHGDIKPSNFLLSQTNPIHSQPDAESSIDDEDNVAFKDSTELVVYLNDLAYARPLGVSQQSGNTTLLDQPLNNAKIFGTPAYLAPECWHGQPISIQSDMYALGVSLYELFVEQKPYLLVEESEQGAESGGANGDTANMPQSVAKAWARLHCQKAIPLLPYQWGKLQPIIDKLLAKRIQNRYQSIDQAIQALQVLKSSV